MPLPRGASDFQLHSCTRCSSAVKSSFYPVNIIDIELDKDGADAKSRKPLRGIVSMENVLELFEGLMSFHMASSSSLTNSTSEGQGL